MEQIINQAAKWLYMSAGKAAVPLVIRLIIGRGWGQGPQHSQSLEVLFSHIPGLKVVAPSSPGDVLGLMNSAVNDPDPVIFYEHKSLYASKEELESTELSIPLGQANILHEGSDITIIGLALMAQRAKKAAIELKEKHNINAKVIDLRTLVPLDLQSIKSAINETGLAMTVEENPRLCGWGAEISSLITEHCFSNLKGPVTRLTTPHVPLPSADILEDNTIPSVDVIVREVIKKVKGE